MKRLRNNFADHFFRNASFLRMDDMPEGTKDDGLLWFVASTEDEASDGHRLLYTGWETEQYARNPQIDWAHASHPGLCGGRSGAPMFPIARGEQLRVNHEMRRLEVGIKFASGVNPRTKQPYHRDAELVEYLCREGFLNMVSVDFRMLDTIPLNQIDPTGAYARFRDEEASDWQMLSIKHRLYAIGIVPIGADDNALMFGRTAPERAANVARAWLDTDDGKALLREFVGDEMRRSLEAMVTEGRIQVIGGGQRAEEPAGAAEEAEDTGTAPDAAEEAAAGAEDVEEPEAEVEAAPMTMANWLTG